MKKLLIWKKLTQPSRLAEYRHLLEFARNRGYVLTSLIDWYRHYRSKEQRVLILRHDVDVDPVGAAKMYAIEKQLGAQATYYFRWRTIDASLIHKMLQDGFEVALHYETLATYCKKQRIRKAAAIDAPILRQCFSKLVDEIKIFRQRFGEMSTIASHGDKRNRLLGIPNWVILSHGDRNLLGIEFEAYDPEIQQQFEAYISDSSITKGFAWQYGTTPEEAIKNDLSPICLLTHPEHWNFSLEKKLKSLVVDFCERLG